MIAQRFVGMLQCAALMLALSLTTGPVAAAGFPPVFLVAGVPVDATAANAVAAKEAARSQGMRVAFRRLLERLTAPSDWQRLPQPGEDAITALVQDIEVEGERSSQVRYLASYSFRFNPNGVRRLLQSGNIPFTEVASKPVILVPMLQLGGTGHLWDDPNPWRDAWNLVKGRQGLVPWVVPAGDLADLAVLDPSQLTAGPPAADQLQHLAQRYGGGDVVVATATAGTEGVIEISAIRYSPEGIAEPTLSTRVSGARLEPALWQAGVIATERELETAWKRLVLSQGPGDSGGTMEVEVPVSRPADWAAIRGRLERVPTIAHSEVELMSRNLVRLKLELRGDPGVLKVALAQFDLVLEPGAGLPQLRLRQNSSAAPPAGDADPGKPVE